LNARVSNRTLPFLTPTILLRAYAAGVFPMAESAEAKELHWFDPPIRAVIPLDARFHVPRRLARTLRNAPFKVTVNRAFHEVMKGCAEPREGREMTWINAEIFKLYTSLFYRGNAHSLEVWKGNDLVGGLYGVSLGSAFFGESMFSRETDASKIALVHLVGLLRNYGYTLLDTQFKTSHLQKFGAFEIVRSDYLSMLHKALELHVKPFASYPEWTKILSDVLAVGKTEGEAAV
jgi:leucyl/phenylalanyl-tRNA--protein transferase